MCLTRTYAESQLASCTDGSCRVHGKPKPCSVRQSNGTSSLLALSRIDPEMMGIPEGNSDRALPASRTKPNGRQCQCGHPAHLRQTDCSRQINRTTPSMRSPQPSADTIRVSTPTSIGYGTTPCPATELSGAKPSTARLHRSLHRILHRALHRAPHRARRLVKHRIEQGPCKAPDRTSQ